MKLKLTKHFYERLVERGWDLNIIREVILNPDKVEKQDNEKLKYLKFDWKRYIHVVVSRIDGENYILITYYKTTKTKLL